jgi:hypothetical protein
VRNAENAASSARLGSRRFGSAVIFDARGYALTVSYLLLDSIELEARGRDGRAVPARVVGVDLDTGLGVVKLEGDGPWPVATLGWCGATAAPEQAVGLVATAGDEAVRRSRRPGSTCSIAPSSSRPTIAPSAAAPSSTRAGTWSASRRSDWARRPT